MSISNRRTVTRADGGSWFQRNFDGSVCVLGDNVLEWVVRGPRECTASPKGSTLSLLWCGRYCHSFESNTGHHDLQPVFDQEYPVVGGYIGRWFLLPSTSTFKLWLITSKIVLPRNSSFFTTCCDLLSKRLGHNVQVPCNIPTGTPNKPQVCRPYS